MHRLVALGVASALLACGSVPPEHTACLNACNAENKCPGAKQERCDSLCNARPPDCTSEYTAWWTCAGNHLDQACGSYLNTCATEFAHWDNCVSAFCLVHALDSNCYY